VNRAVERPCAGRAGCNIKRNALTRIATVWFQAPTRRSPGVIRAPPSLRCIAGLTALAQPAPKAPTAKAPAPKAPAAKAPAPKPAKQCAERVGGSGRPAQAMTAAAAPRDRMREGVHHAPLARRPGARAGCGCCDFQVDPTLLLSSLDTTNQLACKVDVNTFLPNTLKALAALPQQTLVSHRSAPPATATATATAGRRQPSSPVRALCA